jgi:hypothetical protein
MNLISRPGRRLTLVVGGQTLTLPAPRRATGPLMLGVRPEHADLHPGLLALKVELLEMLGAERLVYGRLGDTMFTLRIDGTLHAPKPGDTVHCWAPPRTCTGSTPPRASGSKHVTAWPCPCGLPTAAPASWRPRTRWRPFAWAPRTATAPSNAT